MGTQEVNLPVSPAALLQRCAGEPDVFLLDGSGPASWMSGAAVFGFGPSATLRVATDGSAVMWDGRVHAWQGHPFDLLDRFCAPTRLPVGDAPQPDAAVGGGVVVALSYDLRRWVERLPTRHSVAPTTPILHAARYDWLLSYAYTTGRYYVAARTADVDLGAVVERLRRLADMPVPVGALPRSRVRADMPRADYRAAVRRALAYIAAGDVYQVNLAQRFSILEAPPPATVFARLQRRHPVPFAAYVDGGDFVLVSNSPECFLMRRGAQVATFPIKGTRPRGDGAAADTALRAELRTSAKEQAEHVMIVDLERNDLGRVCRTGTVTVPELAAAQTFPSVHHLVSEVRGELQAGTSTGGLLRATFPGGSITGAPKIRAMQIIDELEPVARGFYTGAVGLVADSGDLVLNLTIRTGVATAQGFTYHAGGGIVADSDPEREYEETLVKSRAFLAALDTEEQ